MTMFIIHCITFLSAIVITYAQVSDNFLLAADVLHGKIHQISLTTKELVSLNIPGLLSPTGVIYDHRTRDVYVADYENKTVHRCTLFGTQCATFSTGIGHPDRITMDFSTGNIFYTGSLFKTQLGGYIGVIKPSQNAHGYLLAGLTKPRGIAVYPSKGFIFWTDYALHHIGRSAMDGFGISLIVSTSIQSPDGLAIDYSGKMYEKIKMDRIYWTDGYYNHIESSDLDGKGRVVHLTDSGAHMVDIIVQGSYLYYTAWNESIITKVSKSTYDVVPWMSNATEFGRIDSIDIYPSDPQPTHQLCSSNNGGCTTFCLPTSTSRACQCAIDIAVARNTTCQEYKKCNTDFPNGKFSAKCSADPGSTCSFECDSGYKKTLHDTKLITCLQNATWNESTISLCEVVRCNTIFNGGRISEQCSSQPGATCSYECDKGYSKKTDKESVTCQLSGEWNEAVSTLCQEIKCHLNLPHGRIVSSCSGRIAEMCFYQCLEGYIKHTKQGAIVCLSDGNWNTSLISICEEIKEESSNITTIAAVVGGGVGGLIIVICIVVILFRKHRISERSTQRIPKTVSLPPVYYTPEDHTQQIPKTVSLPPVYYTPETHISVEYLTPIDQDPYDEIGVYNSRPVVPTGSPYETFNEKADEGRLYSSFNN